MGKIKAKLKKEARERRHRRVRAKIKGTAERPRLSVFRSLKHIYAQLIDDTQGNTLVAANDLEIKKISQKIEKDDLDKFSTKVRKAYLVGQLLAEKAIKKGIKKVVFDRGGYKYHGRVKALAEGARKGGLKF